MAAILVVDDDFSMRKGIALMLKGEGYTVFEAEDERSAEAIASSLKVDVAVVDVFLGDGDGVSLAEALHKNHPQTEIMLMSAHTESEKIHAVKLLYPGRYMDKSAIAGSLLPSIRALLQ